LFLPAEDEAPATAEVVHRLPALSRVFPQGWNPGSRLEVEVYGEHLDGASRAYFLGQAIRAQVKQVDPTRATLELDIPASVGYGEHYFRLVSPRGASNVMIFRIGDQPHHLEHEPNSRMEEAERVSVPVTINARLERDGDYDFYRFEAKAGERWIFDLRSARNGNGLDAALILLDARGRKLDHVEDHFVWDPFIAHTFAEDGDYFAVVQPSHTRNDPSFTYQLDIRRAPYLQTMSPISLAPGEETEVTLFGEGLTQTAAALLFSTAGFQGRLEQARGQSAVARIMAPADARLGEHEMVVESHGRSNPVKFLVEATRRHRGGEIAIPASINGVARYRQPERFGFRASAGQRLVFEVRAQRYGSPVDSVLRILDENGKVVATNDDGAFPGISFNKDSRMMHTFKETGRYEVEMRNLVAVTGENYPYQLLVEEARGSVELMLGSDQPYVYPGESRKLKVTADRRDGFEGEVELQVRGLPEGVEAAAVKLEAGAKEAEIEIKANGAPVGTFAEIQITAEQAKAPAWRSVRIASGGGEGAAFARLERAALAVVEKPLFSLEALATSVALVRGGSAEVKLAVRRQAGFSEPLRFRAENLPEGVELKAEPAEGDSAMVRLVASPQAALGRAARVAILGLAGGQQQEAPKISVVVD